MSNVYNKAHELVNEIKKSSEYIAYIKLKEEVSKDPKNKEILDDFRDRAIKLQLAELSGEDIDKDSLSAFEKLQEIISLNPSLNEYMRAEIKFSQMIQDINEIVAKGIELD